MTPNNGKSEKSKINRRQFLGMAWTGSLAVLSGQSLAALFKFLRPVNTGGFGGVVNAGKVSDFPPGSISQNKAGRFYLYRLDDGSFMALWQRCTHLGCNVPWVEGENQFHCPCHGSLFDKKGIVLGGPAPRPLDVFLVTINDGEVFVDTGNPVQRAGFDPSQTTKA
jgi:cytochrome b6-f complex iron-sulfur subunit